MRLSRRSRHVTALFALFTVLFMQLAVAAYACSPLQTVQVNDMIAMDMHAGEHEGMAGCEGMADIEQAALCHAHCEPASQSLDKPAMPDVSPSVAVLLVPFIADIDIANRPVSTRVEASWLMRGAAPPLSIRNCCFRI